MYSSASADWVTVSQGVSRSDGNAGKLCITQSSKIDALVSDSLISYPGHSFVGSVFPLCRDPVGVFYGPSQLGSAVF